VKPGTKSRISNLESRIFFLTQTSAQIPDNDNWLNQGERIVLAGFRFPKRSNDWRLGRWTAKQAICAWLGKGDALLSSLEIRKAEDGAPEAFWEGEPAGVSISISHSRERSLCAVGCSSLAAGCDLEWIEPREENFAADYFTPEEISLVLHSPLESALIVNLIWSAKEAVLKAVRKGLSRDTRSVLIRPDLGGAESSWNSWTGQCLESSRLFHGWWRTGEGFIYTIASDQPVSSPVELSA
jgi:4'-phosphopantetheinyl transferase